MYFKQDGAISTLKSKPLKLADHFTYLDSNISSTESNVNIHIQKICNAIDRLLTIWKFNRPNKIKQDFFLAKPVSVLLYGCTTRTQKKRFQKKLDDNYTIMLCAILNKSRKQYPIKQQLHVHLPSISQTIQVRRARYFGFQVKQGQTNK